MGLFGVLPDPFKAITDPLKFAAGVLTHPESLLKAPFELAKLAVTDPVAFAKLYGQLAEAGALTAHPELQLLFETAANNGKGTDVGSLLSGNLPL